MSAKVIVLCISAIWMQLISGQCLGKSNYAVNNCGCGAAGPGNGAGGLGPAGASANGGAFSVTSISPLAPTGVAVISDYALEGPLAVNGQLPLLSAVALEGALPTGGQGGVKYNCGDGNIGIVSVNGNGYGYPAGGSGYGAGNPKAAAGRCGCSVY